MARMTDARWRYLMDYDDATLDESEINEGWHWCQEFDGLLVGPGSSELHCCQCLEPDHPVYSTKPPLPEVVVLEEDFRPQCECDNANMPDSGPRRGSHD